MNSVTDVLRENLYKPALSAMSAQSASNQGALDDLTRRPVYQPSPAAKLLVRSAREYNAETNSSAARATNRALLLAKSALTGLQQLIQTVDQMKVVAQKGASADTSNIDRVFLRMDLADLYKEYNAIASATTEDLVGGLSGKFTKPVQIERYGDLVPQQGYTFFSLGSLPRPIGAGDQLRLRVGTSTETVFTASQDLYSQPPAAPVDSDGNGTTDPVEEAAWAEMNNVAGNSVIQALEASGSLTDADTNSPLLTDGYPFQFADGILFASRESGQFLTVRAFFPVSETPNQQKAGTVSVAFQAGNAPVVLQSLADTRLRALETGQNAIVSFSFPTGGGAGYLGGADATNIPVMLIGGTGTGGRGSGELKEGSFTSLVFPFRGVAYSPGDNLGISLADLASYGYGFSTTIGVGSSGEITEIAQAPQAPFLSGGFEYLAGGSGDRIPVKILQSQVDFSSGNITDVANAAGMVNIRNGEIVSITVTSGGIGYVAEDADGIPVPVTVQVDPISPTQTATVKVLEVGNGNISSDAFIYDAVNRSIDAVVGRSFFGESGSSGSSAPSTDQFSSVAVNLESLTQVLKKQQLQAKLEVDRLDAQIQSFGGLDSKQLSVELAQDQKAGIDYRSIKLTRMLSRAEFESSTLTLIKAAQSQGTLLKFEWSKGENEQVK